MSLLMPDRVRAARTVSDNNDSLMSGSQIWTLIVISGVLAVGILTVWYFGFRIPPATLFWENSRRVESLKTEDGATITLTDRDRAIFRNLVFYRAQSESPGATPDYITQLIGKGFQYLALYTTGDKYIFFQFGDDVTYGFFTQPPPGGWNKPLYKINASKSLLTALFSINTD
jgi:hypothetical protein